MRRNIKKILPGAEIILLLMRRLSFFLKLFSIYCLLLTDYRRGARVVEWDGLENRCGGNSTQGSNPCLSAILRQAQDKIVMVSLSNHKSNAQN